jgi:RNA polymerase sigma factor (TIGR02999 family)
MADHESVDLELLLQAVNESKPGAADALAAAVYTQLRARAGAYFARHFGRRAQAVTLQPTVLANDAIMKLLQQRQQYDNAGHFFAIASIQMRRLLIDYSRAREADKRGGDAVRVSYDPEMDGRPGTEASEVDAEALDAALERLRQLDARKAEVVQYRILWGFTTKETAEKLGISVPTVERDWAFAKAWLAKELSR